MPVCENETWENGKRPKNLAWALDDIYIYFKLDKIRGEKSNERTIAEMCMYTIGDKNE